MMYTENKLKEFEQACEDFYTQMGESYNDYYEDRKNVEHANKSDELARKSSCFSTLKEHVEMHTNELKNHFYNIYGLDNEIRSKLETACQQIVNNPTEKDEFQFSEDTLIDKTSDIQRLKTIFQPIFDAAMDFIKEDIQKQKDTLGNKRRQIIIVIATVLGVVISIITYCSNRKKESHQDTNMIILEQSLTPHKHS